MQLQHTKIIGAQKARTLVKNHCRHATMSSVFFVSIHVWLSIAIVDVGARKGRFRGEERPSEYCFVMVSTESCNEIIDYESRATTMLYPGVIKRVSSNNKSKALQTALGRQSSQDDCTTVSLRAHTYDSQAATSCRLHLPRATGRTRDGVGSGSIFSRRCLPNGPPALQSKRKTSRHPLARPRRVWQMPETCVP